MLAHTDYETRANATINVVYLPSMTVGAEDGPWHDWQAPVVCEFFNAGSYVVSFTDNPTGTEDLRTMIYSADGQKSIAANSAALGAPPTTGNCTVFGAEICGVRTRRHHTYIYFGGQSNPMIFPVNTVA